MDCGVCNALKQAVEALEREYANARGRRAEMTQADAKLQDLARRVTEDSRLTYERANAQLEQHQRMHAKS